MPPAIATARQPGSSVIETEIGGEPDDGRDRRGQGARGHGTRPCHASAGAPRRMRWQPEFISAIGKWNGDFIIVPNLERIFN